MVFGSSHPYVAEAQFSLARIYNREGRFAEAISVCDSSLRIREQTSGMSSLQVARVLQAKGAALSGICQYAKAESCLIRSADIFENSDPPESRACIQSPLNNLGDVYYELGSVEDARRTLEKTLSAGGRDNFTMTTLGAVYAELGRWREAEAMYPEVLERRRANLGPRHFEVAWSLLAIADLLFQEGKYDEAGRDYREAASIAEHAFGSKHPDLADCWFGLGKTLHVQGHLRQAADMYLKALRVREETLGLYHPRVAESLYDLSVLYAESGNLNEARSYGLRVYEVRRENFRNGFEVLSERNALNYSRFMRDAAGNILSVLCSDRQAGDRYSQAIATIALSSKGIVFDGMLSRKKALMAETDSSTAKLTDSLRTARFRLADLYVRGPVNGGTNRNRREGKARWTSRQVTTKSTSIKGECIAPPSCAG